MQKENIINARLTLLANLVPQEETFNEQTVARVMSWEKPSSKLSLLSIAKHLALLADYDKPVSETELSSFLELENLESLQSFVTEKLSTLDKESIEELPKMLIYLSSSDWFERQREESFYDELTLESIRGKVRAFLQNTEKPDRWVEIKKTIDGLTTFLKSKKLDHPQVGANFIEFIGTVDFNDDTINSQMVIQAFRAIVDFKLSRLPTENSEAPSLPISSGNIPDENNKKTEVFSFNTIFQEMTHNPFLFAGMVGGLCAVLLENLSELSATSTITISLASSSATFFALSSKNRGNEDEIYPRSPAPL